MGIGDASQIDDTLPFSVVELLGAEPVIGPYELLQRIGCGGTGEVWLAEQRQPVRRRVAIKLIKPGMDTRDVLARFESERQTLAVMDHPAIAKVFDAGCTPLGRPYFVMEHVNGLAITEYCDNRLLNLRQRLELLIEVCAGVQYAHQKAIIHRDLKPSNILVTEIDGKAAPRIIDFGIAKAMAPSLTGDTVFTRVGAIVGTPGYMSPEQAECSQDGIDTRADVYSLGVILYELLVGAKPIDLSKTTLDQLVQTMRRGNVPRPSTRNPSKELTKDLDAIVLKALEFERSLRYPTPVSLSADIERYLRNEPVEARPAGALYRARKFVRRHRIGVTVAAVSTLVFFTLAFLQSVELRNTRRERERADRITRFMKNMFKVSNPSEVRGNTITAREILDQASREISSGLAEDPLLQARLMYIMGTVYDELGLNGEALAMYSKALSIQQRILGPMDRETLESTRAVGWILEKQGQLPEAAKMLKQAQDGLRAILGAGHSDALKSTNGLAATLYQLGKKAEAEHLQREALALSRQSLGPDHERTLFAMSNLSNMLIYQRRFSEAYPLQSEVLERRRKTLGPTHFSTIQSMAISARLLSGLGRYQEAIQVNAEALALASRYLGPKHPLTLAAQSDYGDQLDRLGRSKEAEALLKQTVQSLRETLGSENPNTRNTILLLAKCLMHLGRYAEAEGHVREALAGATVGEDAGNCLFELGVIALHRRSRDQALALLNESFSRDPQPWRVHAFETDPDLKPLRGEPGFEALLTRVRQQVNQPPIN